MKNLLFMAVGAAIVYYWPPSLKPLQVLSQTNEGERQLLLIMHDTCNAVLQRIYFDGVITHEEEFEAKQLLCYGFESDSLNAKRLDAIKKGVYP